VIAKNSTSYQLKILNTFDYDYQVIAKQNIRVDIINLHYDDK
jgi:hypothetical protein